jgi:hypothetical protein
MRSSGLKLPPAPTARIASPPNAALRVPADVRLHHRSTCRPNQRNRGGTVLLIAGFADAPMNGWAIIMTIDDVDHHSKKLSLPTTPVGVLCPYYPDESDEGCQQLGPIGLRSRSLAF